MFLFRGEVTPATLGKGVQEGVIEAINDRSGPDFCDKEGGRGVES
jgi:hypothetical protein